MHKNNEKLLKHILIDKANHLERNNACESPTTIHISTNNTAGSLSIVSAFFIQIEMANNTYSAMLLRTLFE
jgi:hypothetical protein